MDHLVTTAAQFRNEDSRRYAASIQRFNAYFTDEAIRTFWTRILLDRPGTTKLPP
jgi:hypothetical protein